jgi:outer membrane protein
MSRILIGFLLVLVAVPMVAMAEEPVAPPPDPALGLGTVRGDTIYVSRDKMVALALEQNEMLAASGAMRDAAGAEATGALRAFLPQVQLGSFFLRSDDALNAFGYTLQNRAVTAQDFNPALLNNPGETNHFVSRLQLLQPIFNGGMGINGKQAANAMSRAAEYDHQRAKETVEYRAIQAFEGLALAKAFEDVMIGAVASAEGHVKQARSMVNAEMATEADLLQAQVYLSGLQQQLIEVRNMKAVAGENIKLLTAVTIDLPLAADITSIDPAALSFAAEMDSLGGAGRSDILSMREQADAAGQMVAVAQGTMLPHINMSVQRDLYSQEDLFGDDARSWTLGVYATWDVFKGMQNIGEIKKAKAQKRAAEYMVQFQTRQAQVQATEALLDAQAAHEKVMVARGAVDAAREGLRIVTNQYREGLASMVNLLDVQAAAIMAEGNLVQALHDYQVGMANLEYSGAAPRTGPALSMTSAATEASPATDR